ncbi:DUF368 domain-containing protein [Mailhella sp.]|uniref:DUF368 domain-containing protein n=1 Tax=Mailhella sp. TaxID=1981029 RepID=UPI004063D43D
MFEKLRYLLCGLAMGAADVVPGVSGGTIAYITGIYDQLLNAIKAFNAAFFRDFFTGQWKRALGRVPWGFLLPVLLGVGTSIFSLAKLTLYLLKTYPHELWAFFFGLIMASIVLMSRGRSFRGQHYAVMAVGAALTWWLTGAGALNGMPHSYPYLFGAGFIALCAMILPGISGSFMLVLMGQYTHILSAVAHFRVDVLAVFAAGGVMGLMTFSRVLSACFRKFPAATNAFLIGVMAGSLRVVWPWHRGPSLALPPFDGSLLCAAGACALGVALPLVVEAIATRK